MDKFSINVKTFPVSEQYSRKFKSMCKINRIVFEYSSYSAGRELELKQIVKEVYRSLDQTIKNILSPYNENDYLRISVKNEILEREIYLPFRQIKFFNINQIFDEMNKILQSKKDTIGLRIPANNIARTIIKELGRPILSASLPGEMVEDYTDPEIMYENFMNDVEIVVDGGIGGTVPSTIIDCTTANWEITRQELGEWE